MSTFQNGIRCATLLLAANVAALAQISGAVDQDLSEIAESIAEGKYARAYQCVAMGLDKARTQKPDYEPGPFLAYLGELSLETGRLQTADEALKKAESQLVGIWSGLDALVVREQAALYLARGDFTPATIKAATAYKMSVDRYYLRVETAYCKSLEAQAELRMGNLPRAEILVREALRDIPKNGKQLFFVPRILYTACLIESYRGNHTEAQGYCLRGLEMAEKSGAETRDTSLGHLALAEAYLQSGDFEKSHASGLLALTLTYRMFGRRHQDMVDALHTLALADLRAGRITDARVRAKDALQAATQLFGAGSQGEKRQKEELRGALKE